MNNKRKDEHADMSNDLRLSSVVRGIKNMAKAESLFSSLILFRNAPKIPPWNVSYLSISRKNQIVAIESTENCIETMAAK